MKSEHEVNQEFLQPDLVPEDREYQGKRDMEVVRGISLAMGLVLNHVNMGAEHGILKPGDVYVVWFCKTLQNWKALVSTVLPDNMYYEVTYNGNAHETYLDAYKKIHNLVIGDETDVPEEGTFLHQLATDDTSIIKPAPEYGDPPIYSQLPQRIKYLPDPDQTQFVIKEAEGRIVKTVVPPKNEEAAVNEPLGREYEE